MNTEKLHSLISAILEDIFKDSPDTLEHSIRTIPHNGAEVQLNYIYADKTSKTGFSSAPCADPVTVYGIAGTENIRRKLKEALV